jgi:hypothetical protein
LMVMIVGIGIFPGPFFDRIRPSVAPIAARVEASRTPRAIVLEGSPRTAARPSPSLFHANGESGR